MPLYWHKHQLWARHLTYVICLILPTTLRRRNCYLLVIQQMRKQAWGDIKIDSEGKRNWCSTLKSMENVAFQLLCHVQLFATPWIAAYQVSLSFTISQSLLKLMSIESVMPSNYLTLCCPLILSLSIFLSIRDLSNELALRIRWQKYWSFGISPSNKYSGLISFKIDWFDLPVSKQLSRIFSSTTVQKHQFFSALPSSWYNSHIHTWLLEKP